MLHRLEIRDYLLIRELALEFPDGFIVLTGETGAGKSMILGAIDVLLGGGVPKQAVRGGADRAVIEGEFRLPEVDSIIQQVGEEYFEDSNHELLVRREISAKGRTRSFLNDHPIPRERLLRVRELLVDFHGQREHQSLFRPSQQLEYLDVYAGTTAIAEEFAGMRSERRRSAEQLRDLAGRLADHTRDQALLAYQLEEIERLGLRRGEEEEVEAQLRKLENAEMLALKAAELHSMLSDDDRSMSVMAGRARHSASELGNVDRELVPLARELAEIEARIKDLGGQIRDYAGSVEIDEQKLEELRERRGILWDLKRKHGMSVEEIIGRAGELKELLTTGDALRAEVESVTRDLEERDRKLKSCAEKLSRKRRQRSDAFAKAVGERLKPMGFSKARFEVALESRDEFDPETIGRAGMDRIEFRFAANPGSGLRSLGEVASGGESSRLTLAIKSVIADRVDFPMMIYDEVDLGISGGVAERVGQVLSGLGRRHQLVSITHLPQIASQADHHLLVEKKTSRHKTETTARFLDKGQRVTAIAALLSGTRVSHSAVESAGELLRGGSAKNKKAGTIG